MSIKNNTTDPSLKAPANATKKWQMSGTRLAEILSRHLEKNKTQFDIVGSSSPVAISNFLSNSFSLKINDLPNIIVVSSLQDALNLEECLSCFSGFFRVHILQPWDVSIYSGLTPSPAARNSRSNFLYWASRAEKNDIFVLPISSLLQKTSGFAEFNKLCRRYSVGDLFAENIDQFLVSLGYQSSTVVEDVGQYSMRGGILDIFSPAEKLPIRVELFGEQIESLRFFSVNDQRSQQQISHLNLAPVYEFTLTDENIESIISKIRTEYSARGLTPTDADESIRSITLKNYFSGSEYLLPYCYKNLSSVLDHFSSGLNLFFSDPATISRAADEYFQEIEAEYRTAQKNPSVLFCPNLEMVLEKYENLAWPEDSRHFRFSNLAFVDEADTASEKIAYPSLPLTEFSALAQNLNPSSEAWLAAAKPKIQSWLGAGYKIFIAGRNSLQTDRLKVLLDRLGLPFQIAAEDEFLWEDWIENKACLTLLPRSLSETVLINEEKLIFLRSDDFFGKKQKTSSANAYEQFSSKAKSLAFGDLKPNDLVVHVKHGIGVYEGLKIMDIGGAQSEFIQIAYKDKDKLYLPVYRVAQLQKFSGPSQAMSLDKLGGTAWEKTKIKVKSHLKDIAAELLQLYAKRNEITRPKLEIDEFASDRFMQAFPFEETDDQLKAINDIHKDFTGIRPMDRLICGDVGFGKTEVAMRAAFLAAQAKKQVAVLAPTTVLTFQHLETFKKRFAGWNFEIKSLNRFVSAAEQKKTLAELKEGKVDILIGTHRLLSKDVQFKNLGLLIIDEEQKFGVTHKEKIKKLKTDVDTLTLSATPIPRTLNMSFTGMRDLSIINTAPVDRLPTRTFISKFDPELIRKAVTSEISRGGQVYFIHNRVQSIYALADELRQILPEARMRVAHGQMSEDELEGAMLSFFNHEIDILVCTAIVESGMDVSRANTMFIDQAHMFGLSQLYQLRGRVGRSKARAFCYLLLPKDKKIDKLAQERLKVIQENSALGSGIRIAQYDLELRGAGNILGDDQSGHVNSVGYELYMDLLNEALADAKGESIADRDLDPEINLKVPALIPDSYISDIRIRLSYYKALSEISSHEELDRIEDELKDQFGPLPEPVLNLMGLMLIRKQCKDLGVRDVSAGAKSVSLIFTEKTKLKPEVAIKLAMRENKKYSITPDQRLNVRMNAITWSNVYEELNYLLSLV